MATCYRFIFIVYILVALSIKCQTKSTTTTSYLLITRVGPCNTKINGTVVISEFQISQEPKTENFTITGTLNFKSDIDNGWNVKATVERCLDIRNTDTCDHFRSISIVANGCNSKSDAIFSLAQYSEPSISCPIRSGKYNIKRLPYTAKDHFKASQSSSTASIFGYNVNIKAYTGNVTHGCMNILMRLWYAREHNWSSTRAEWQNEGDAEGVDEILPDVF